MRLLAEYNRRQQGLLIEASGVPDPGFAEVNRGRSPVDVCKVSTKAARAWDSFLRGDGEQGLVSRIP